MIVEIEPHKLSSNLWRTGPYMYFFKKNNDIKNSSIICSVNYLANKYSKIKTFQIIWEKQILYNSSTPIDHKNTIFLYFRGKYVKEIFEPKHDELEDFFKEGVKYYKERLNIFFTNQGSRLKNYQENEKIKTCVENNNLSLEKISRLLYRKRIYAKEWKAVSCSESSPYNINSNLNKMVEKQKNTEIESYAMKIERFPTDERSFVKKLIRDEFLMKIVPETPIKINTHIQNKTIVKKRNKSLKTDNISDNEKWFTKVENIYKLPNEFLNEVITQPVTRIKNKNKKNDEKISN